MSETNFFDSPRIARALEQMRKGKVDIETLDITEYEIDELINLGVNVVKKPNSNLYYIDSNNSESMFEVISLKNKEEKHVRWVECGSLLAGHCTFDREALESLLSEAVNRGYEEVHFSGDLCAGPPPKANQAGNGEWLF